jgi:MscS family membrane protein
LIFDGGLAALALPVPAYRWLGGTATALVIVAVVWLLLRLTDVFAMAAERRLTTQTKHASAGIVPLGRRAVKVVLTIIAVLAALENFGFNVTGVLAALGVGGLAVALAAQKTVENLFGGISIIVDQPVRVGDLCRFGDRTGVVEDIGLRSTRIRTPERTVIAVPNGDFSNMQLENLARRDRMFLQAKLGLHYEASGRQVRTVLDELRKLLLGNSKVDADTAQVRFVAFGATALELEVSAYVRTTDVAEFGAIREDLFLRMMDVIAASGVGFAAAKTVVAPAPSPS